MFIWQVETINWLTLEYSYMYKEMSDTEGYQPKYHVIMYNFWLVSYSIILSQLQVQIASSCVHYFEQLLSVRKTTYFNLQLMNNGQTTVKQRSNNGQTEDRQWTNSKHKAD